MGISRDDIDRVAEAAAAEVSKRIGTESAKPTRPTREDVTVDNWIERDRLGIWITDNRTGSSIAEWWDDAARQMFEDGFFKEAMFTRGGELKGGEFSESVLDYAEEVGLLARS